MIENPKMIHIWSPGIREGSGGIQAFTRCFVQAVHEIYPQARLRMVLKNDAPGPDDPLRKLPVTFHTTQNIPRALRSLAYASLGVWLGLRHAPDLAMTTHVHYLPPMGILRRFRGTRCVSVLHGIDAWNLKGSSRIRALRLADDLIAVSRYTKIQVMELFGIKPDRIDVVPNTFDAARFAPGPKPPHLLARFGIRPHQPVILCVSRLARTEIYKGHRQALYALAQVRKDLPDVRYIIAGDGDDIGRLREVADVLQLSDSVTFAGYVPDDQLPDFYRLCDVFLMPSAKEGFGIVFLEAMAAGKPAIGGNRDGSMDALDDGRLGVLVDPFDSHQIAGAIKDVLLRRHPNHLIFDSEKLSHAVGKTFGYARFRDLLKKSLGNMGREQSVSPRPASLPRVIPVGTSAPAPRIVIITQLTSPYQVELFNTLAANESCRLEVIYLMSKYPERHWSRPGMAHIFTVLDEEHNNSRALTIALEADLVIFNNYISAFSFRALRERVRSGQPWVFWGERPGRFRLGAIGRWFRRLALMPLHRSRAPIWGIGKFGVDGYRAEFGDHHSYHDVPYFSDLSKFQPKPKVAGTNKVFLFSGALTHRKGADLVARAFAKIARNRRDVHLLIMGAGAMEAQMRADLSSVSGQVTWLGFRDWDELPESYNGADFLCAPSRHDGWGLAVIEGLASGLPVISTRHTGAALEFVEDGKNGWMCPVNDDEAVALAMTAAADLLPNEYDRMSSAARESVAHHTLEHGAALFYKASLEAIQSWRI